MRFIWRLDIFFEEFFVQEDMQECSQYSDGGSVMLHECTCWPHIRIAILSVIVYNHRCRQSFHFINLRAVSRPEAGTVLCFGIQNSHFLKFKRTEVKTALSCRVQAD